MKTKSPHTKIVGLIGHGAFGQLLSKHLARFFKLLIFDSNCQDEPHPPGARRVALLEQLSACDAIILAVPVQALEATCQALAPILKPGCLVMDVCSVKVRPCEIMSRSLPRHVEIVGTHPLFGPQSAAAGIRGLKLVVCPLRGQAYRRLKVFCERALGLNVVLASPDEHDQQLAVSQALTHFLTASLRQLELPEVLTTVSFDLIKKASQMVSADSAALLEAIESWNPYSRQARQRFLDHALRLHGTLSASPSAFDCEAR